MPIFSSMSFAIFMQISYDVINNTYNPIYSVFIHILFTRSYNFGWIMNSKEAGKHNRCIMYVDLCKSGYDVTLIKYLDQGHSVGTAVWPPV